MRVLAELAAEDSEPPRDGDGAEVGSASRSRQTLHERTGVRDCMGRTLVESMTPSSSKGRSGRTLSRSKARLWFRVCDVRCGLGIAIATANAEKKASKHGSQSSCEQYPARSVAVKHEAVVAMQFLSARAVVFEVRQ